MKRLLTLVRHLLHSKPVHRNSQYIRKFLVIYSDGNFKFVTAETKEQAAKTPRFGPEVPARLNMDAPHIPVINVLDNIDIANIAREMMAVEEEAV